MSGCYRCGLPEGSGERLCETCFRLRFYRGCTVVDPAPGATIEGIELSAQGRRAVVATGALVYVGVVGFFAMTMGRPILPPAEPRVEFILDAEAARAHEHRHSFGPVTVQSPKEQRAALKSDGSIVK